YLERTSARQYVGQLSKIGGKFVFEYNETYQYSENALPFGPDLPISQRRHSSLKLFPSFADRIPSRENPAYEEYCRSVGISPSEKNLFILLVKLGRKGPSSFILAPVSEESDFSREDLKQFRKDLNLSIREFAELFDVSSATIYRIENNKSSGKSTLKRIKIYFDSPEKALEKIKHTGCKINDNKRSFIQTFLKSKFQEKLIGYGLFTVKAEDIQKCSPEQAIELLRRLMLLECSHYGIPGNSVHISSNVSVTDGGQDGLAVWKQGPVQTNYFPRRYNCFQIKAVPLSPSKIIKEIYEKQNLKKLNKAIQYVIDNKGAYVLCSTHGVAGVKIQDMESAIKRELQTKADNLDNVEVKFYDGNRLADWINCHPPVAIWFLKEICGRSIKSWRSWLEYRKLMDQVF
ncbi:MAG: helix-turn-helix domain-containing protein, partial [Bdellovibrionales bacterium]|nr:helix-turn-helix domain-containing protein [Bdellovibrionales bacterium]